MHFRTFILLTLAFVTLACATGGSGSGSRPATVPQPEINADIANEIFFGRGSTAPATIDVRVRNRGPEPITVRRIVIDSPGMTEWGFPRQTRDYREVVAPGEEKNVTFFATAQTITSQRNEPLSYRLEVHFEAGETRWRELVNLISTRRPR
jgi:hypothetical protein